MANKMTSPGIVRAASLTLTGTAATVVGTVSTDNANATSGAIKLGDLAIVMLRCTYTRAGGSATGRPIFRLDVSMDAPTTAAASVSNWQPVYLADVSAGSGAAELYAELQRPNPTASGATVFGTHPVNVSCAHWLRVQIYDVDGATPGAVTNLTFGGST